MPTKSEQEKSLVSSTDKYSPDNPEVLKAQLLDLPINHEIAAYCDELVKLEDVKPLYMQSAFPEAPDHALTQRILDNLQNMGEENKNSASTDENSD